MSLQGPLTAGAASAAVPSPATIQPFIPPPRTSSREPSPSGLVAGNTGSTREQSDLGQKSERTAQPDPAVPAADTNSQQTKRQELSGRPSKRSLIGRRRTGSNSSKRSNRMPAALDEKSGRPGSAGRQSTPGQARAKRKGGFLAFLSCCTASDDSTDPTQNDSAHPAKSAPKQLTTSAQLPQSRQVQQPQQQNASTTGTSTQDSRDAYDEKVGHGVVAADVPTPVNRSDQSPMGDAAVDKPLPPAQDVAPAHQDADESPLTEGKQASPVVDHVTTPPHTDGSEVEPEQAPADTSQKPDPDRSPIPVVIAEPDSPISDRTPQQAQRDEDIEMSDAGVSTPLTAAEGEAIAEDERREHEQLEQQQPHQAQQQHPQLDQDFAAPVGGAALVAAPMVQDPHMTEQSTGDLSHQSSFTSTPEPAQKWLLPPIRPELSGRKCLVLDLDETLVHSSFKVLHQADFTIPVEIEGQYHSVYVIKRPGVDAFLKRVGELYEVAVFTASVSKYGDPVLDNLDIHKVVHHRLFRESCYNHQGNYVKDLSQIGRDLRETIIIDNSPTSYIFHPQHAVPISSWFSDAHDNELLDLIPVLEDLAGPQVADVSLVLDVAL